MVYALHKFCHYLLSNKIHLLCGPYGTIILGSKTQVSRRITRWLLLFLEHNFLLIYKLGIFHFMANSLYQMHDLTEESEIPDQTMDAPLFLLQLV
jgi:hypothetical protein